MKMQYIYIYIRCLIGGENAHIVMYGRFVARERRVEGSINHINVFFFFSRIRALVDAIAVGIANPMILSCLPPLLLRF